MSIWTSKAAALAVLMGVAACQPVGGGGVVSKLALIAMPQKMTVLEGNVTVVGPAGYCPDTETVREADDRAVVLIGRCSAESEVLAAVVTVSIGQSGSDSAMAAGGAEMASFFKSEAGRATLSRRGNASDISILSAVGVGDMVLLHVQDRAEGRFWRAMLALSGRLVSVTAQGDGLADADNRALVEKTAMALRRANRAR